MEQEKQDPAVTPMTEVTAFVIKRSEWLRGEGAINSYLLREEDGKRCCVGIYARACGVPDDHLAGQSWPMSPSQAKDCANTRIGWAEPKPWVLPEGHWLLERLHDLTEGFTNLSNINDARMDNTDFATFREDDRERLVAKVFARHGITVTFED